MLPLAEQSMNITIDLNSLLSSAKELGAAAVHLVVVGLEFVLKVLQGLSDPAALIFGVVLAITVLLGGFNWLWGMLRGKG